MFVITKYSTFASEMKTIEYPFAHKDHKVYANTFLQNVLVEWYFTPVTEDLDQGYIRRFLDEKFRIQVDEKNNIQYPIVVSTKAKDVQIFLGRDVFKLNVRVNLYKGFSSLSPLLGYGFEYLKLNEVQNINRCLIRKIDVFPFQNISESNTSNETLLSKIFSKELLEGISVSSSNNAFQSFWSKNFNREVESENVNIKFGFQRRQPGLSDKQGENSMLLDLSVERNKDMSFNMIEKNLLEMNQILYNAFHWSVNRDIIDIMGGDDHD